MKNMLTQARYKMNSSSQKQTKKQTAPKLLKPGTTVSWESTASSIQMRKTGVVIAHIPANANWRTLIAQAKPGLIKGIDLESTYHRAGMPESNRERYLVAVNQIGKRKLAKPLLYTPLTVHVVPAKK